MNDDLRRKVRADAEGIASHTASEFARRHGLIPDEMSVSLPPEKAVEGFGDGERPARPWVDRALREMRDG